MSIPPLSFDFSQIINKQLTQCGDFETEPINIVSILISETYRQVLRNVSTTHSESPNWLQFKDHKWEPVVNESILFSHIFRHMNKELKQHVEEATEFSSVYKKILIDLTVIVKNHGLHKKQIINKVSDLLYDGDMHARLNQNKHLICFTNGVYDFTQRKFRNGQPEDYLSMCTGYSYQELNWNDEYIDNLTAFLNSVQSSSEQLGILLDTLVGILSGRITSDKILLYGSNQVGLSSFIKLLKNTFGDYLGSFDIGDIQKTISTEKSPLLNLYPCSDYVDKRIVTIGSNIESLENLPDFQFWTNIIITHGKANVENVNMFSKVFEFNSVSEENTIYQFFTEKTLTHTVSKWKKIFMGILIKRFETSNDAIKIISSAIQ